MNKKLWIAIVACLGIGTFVAASRMARSDTYTPILPFPDPQFCNSPVDTAFILGDAGPNLVPFTPATGRRFVTICNSAENAGAPVVKCGVAPMPTFHDAGILIYDAGCIAIPGVCYHDGGPSCGSTSTYNNVDGGPVLIDAGCFYFDGGPTVDAGCPLVDAGALLDGGFIDAGYTACGAPNYSDAGCNWTVYAGHYNWKDGGFTFNDGGPCLADAGYCLVDGGPQILDAGPQVTDAGWVYQDGGPYLGNTMPGDALKVGDCITYPVGTGEQPLCIGTGSLSTTVGVTAKECR